MAARLNTSWPLSWIRHLHRALIFGRRARVLAGGLAAQIPPHASVLDIGCGDGTIGKLIMQLRPDISIQGVELLTRPGCKIDCRSFDGWSLPFSNDYFDVCLLVDVLHHTQDATVLLCEAARVSRNLVILKDHLKESFIDVFTLRLMDWVGNRPHGVILSYNYMSAVQWAQCFSICDLTELDRITKLSLYPPPFSLILGRKLHFVSSLKKRRTADELISESDQNGSPPSV